MPQAILPLFGLITSFASNAFAAGPLSNIPPPATNINNEEQKRYAQDQQIAGLQPNISEATGGAVSPAYIAQQGAVQTGTFGQGGSFTPGVSLMPGISSSPGLTAPSSGLTGSTSSASSPTTSGGSWSPALSMPSSITGGGSSGGGNMDIMRLLTQIMPQLQQQMGVA